MLEVIIRNPLYSFVFFNSNTARYDQPTDRPALGHPQDNLSVNLAAPSCSDYCMKSCVMLRSLNSSARPNPELKVRAKAYVGQHSDNRSESGSFMTYITLKRVQRLKLLCPSIPVLLSVLCLYRYRTLNAKAILCEIGSHGETSITGTDIANRLHDSGRLESSHLGVATFELFAIRSIIA